MSMTALSIFALPHARADAMQRKRRAAFGQTPRCRDRPRTRRRRQSALPAYEMAEPFLNITRSVTGRAWVSRLGDAEARIAQAITQRSGISEILARIIAARGVGIEQADEYLNPTIRGLM